jgi:hypothetical protein
MNGITGLSGTTSFPLRLEMAVPAVGGLSEVKLGMCEFVPGDLGQVPRMAATIPTPIVENFVENIAAGCQSARHIECFTALHHTRALHTAVERCDQNPGIIYCRAVGRIERVSPAARQPNTDDLWLERSTHGHGNATADLHFRTQIPHDDR